MPRHGNGGRDTDLWSGFASRRLDGLGHRETLPIKKQTAPEYPGRVLAQNHISPKSGQNGGVSMAGSVKTAPPRRERKIGGTTYIVTSYFKEQGVTAADHVRHLIDTATKEQKIRRSR